MIVLHSKVCLMWFLVDFNCFLLKLNVTFWVFCLGNKRDNTASLKCRKEITTSKQSETLEGKISMLSPSLNEVKVKFQSNAGKTSTFKAKEVKEYGFDVEQWNHKTRQHFTTTITYVKKTVERAPIAFGPKEVLIERQVAGTINMYNHFVEMNSNVKTPFEHIIYVEKTANELVSLTKKNYKVVLKEMTAEYPELQAKVGSRGYGFKHVAQIIDTYNNWMLDNGEEIVLGMN